MKKTLFLILLIAISATSLFAVTIDVVIETTMGDITLELYPDVAPLTVTNFIAYANDDFYDGLIFHRIADLSGNIIIQSGGYDPNNIKKRPTYNPLVNEYNLLNTPGTIAMAKFGGNPDSATTEFFINHGDLSEILDENNNGGFTVFGAVTGDGMDIVDLIANASVVDEKPVEDIIIEDIVVSDITILDNVTFVDGEMLLQGDINNDFYVNVQDVPVMAGEWLDEGMADPQELTADLETFSGEYGGAVDIYNDLAIIGAPGENDGMGAAYILKYNGTEWIQQTRVSMEDIGQAGDSFGFSVSIWENLALIGIPNADTSATEIDAGTICVYITTDDPNEPWERMLVTTADDRSAGANFGYSVSIDGGFFAVGAPGNNNYDAENKADSGAVYILDSNSGRQLAKFSGETGDLMGYSVATKNRIVTAGAVTDDNAAIDAGAIHVFRENPATGNWETEQVFTALDANVEDWLGYSVDIDNGIIIAGAGGVDDNGSKSGAVYVFDYLPAGGDDPNSYWEQTAKLTADDGEAFDRFGWSVSIDNDHAIIGAKYYNNIDDDSNAGAAYLFQRDADTGIWMQEPFGTGSGADDYFGHAVAISKNNIIIGAYGVDGIDAGDDSEITNSGAVEIIRFKPYADLNGDDVVDLADFAIMAASWMGD